MVGYAVVAAICAAAGRPDRTEDAPFVMMQLLINLAIGLDSHNEKLLPGAGFRADGEPLAGRQYPASENITLKYLLTLAKVWRFGSAHRFARTPQDQASMARMEREQNPGLGRHNSPLGTSFAIAPNPA